MDIDTAFGKWLAEQRRAKGVSQRALGSSVGAQQQTVLKMEQGKRPVRLSEAVVMAAFLDSPLPAFEVDVPPACPTCRNAPAKGFTCNACGRGGAA